MLFNIKADDSHYKMLTYSHEYKIDSIVAIRNGGTTLIANGTPHQFLTNWKEIEVIFVDGYPENGKAKVMPDIAFTYGRLFLSQKALDMLAETLNATKGELLPVRYNQGLKGFIFNPLCTLEVDHALSHKNADGEIMKIAFTQEALLFKTPFDHFFSLFCSQNFKSIIDQSGLNGLTFTSDLTHYYLDD